MSVNFFVQLSSKVPRPPLSMVFYDGKAQLVRIMLVLSVNLATRNVSRKAQSSGFLLPHNDFWSVTFLTLLFRISNEISLSRDWVNAFKR